MDTQDITWRLANLASLPYQERYVINGTIEEYLVDVDLIENVDSLKFLIWRPEHRHLINKEQEEALNQLFAFIDANYTAAISAPSRDAGVEAMRSGPVWTEMRALSAQALALFGLSVDDMSIDDIDRLSE